MSQVPLHGLSPWASAPSQIEEDHPHGRGQAKAAVVKKVVEGDDTEEVPASLLQNHDDCTFVIDETGASGTHRFKSPGSPANAKWTDKRGNGPW